MKMHFWCLFVLLGVVTSGFCGCASYSQTFIGPDGDIKTCASTSQDQGITGVLLASSRFNKCVKDIKESGYREIDTTGSIGVSLYTADGNGLRVMRVYDNSPASKAGIVRGDIITAINGKRVVQNCDLAFAHGDIGSTVEVSYRRGGNETTCKLVRTRLNYSRMQGDVTY